MNLHPLRVLNFAAVAYILWYVPRSLDALLRRWTPGRFLMYVGAHSLQVYSWSVMVAYTASGFRAQWASLAPAWQAVLAVGATLTLVFPAWVHEGWQQHRRASAQRLALAGPDCIPPATAI
jgi:hypothetical protein